jgi:methylated-DNA-protein-cysteine methyltransferase related protein
MENLSLRIIDLIRKIPRGRVAAYGQIAALAGAPNGARQVARLLHSSSGKHGLPWHRVVNAEGKISLPPGGGFELQKKLLEAEGVRFEGGTAPRPGEGRIDFSKYGWRPVLD